MLPRETFSEKDKAFGRGLSGTEWSVCGSCWRHTGLLRPQKAGGQRGRATQGHPGSASLEVLKTGEAWGGY
ncbi:Glucose-Induced Degradation Protein 4-like [Manis pentadactyla]|nr:Glucose-Induced Degradation Protein 4-like [Manis pentadactyla]